MKWRPIETAPKDGTHVLIFVNGFIRLAHFSSYEYYGRHEGWTMGCTELTGDSTVRFSAPVFLDGKITHWMPLPDPPEGD